MVTGNTDVWNNFYKVHLRTRPSTETRPYIFYVSILSFKIIFFHEKNVTKTCDFRNFFLNFHPIY
jgi:hypothetical protein